MDDDQSKMKRLRILDDSVSCSIDESQNTQSDDPLHWQFETNWPAENPEANNDQSVDWDHPIIIQLEELLTSSLHKIFGDAIATIVGYGYSEEDAKKAISSCILYCGSIILNLKSNLAKDLFLFRLKMGKFDHKIDEPFKDFKNLVEYALFVMISVFLELKPSLTVVNAMCSLFITELNLKKAFEMEGLCPKPDKPNISRLLAFQNYSQNISFKTPLLSEGQTQAKESSVSASDRGEKSLGSAQDRVQTTAKTSVSKGKSAGVEKGKSKRSKKEAKLWKKLSRLEKTGLAIRLSGDSSTAKIKHLPTPISSIQESPKASDYYAENPYIPYDQSLRKFCPRDEKHVLILKLVFRLLGLQKDLQDWTEWTNNYIMQATHKLREIQAELKPLRQYKEDVKQYEDDALKWLNEQELALSSRNDYIEKADSAVRELEMQRFMLEMELGEAKIEAEESDKKFRIALDSEQKRIKKIQALAGEKRLLRETIAGKKVELAALQQEVDNLQSLQNQIEAKWEQERKEKEELLTKAASIKWEREQLEAQMPSQEALHREDAEKELQKHMEKRKILEDEISAIESSNIEALRKGMDGSSQPHHNACKRVDQECVMCLSEEKTVVFLPCAHQVVCENCNKRHEMNGMKDCPSCRTTIAKRISTRYDHHIRCEKCNKLYEMKRMKECPYCGAPILWRITLFL